MRLPKGLNPGFTLVDLLIAITVMAVIMIAVQSVFIFQERTIKAALENREVFVQGQAILDRLTRDLNGLWLPTAYSGQAMSPQSGTTSPTTQTGLLTNPTTQTGRVKYRFEAKADRLDFATTATLAQEEHPGQEIVEVGYRVLPGEEGGRTKILVRRQDEKVDDDPTEGGIGVILTKNLVSLDITFPGGQNRTQEVTTWQATSLGSLPKAIRVKLVLATAEDNKETFLALISPPVAQGEIKSQGSLKNLLPTKLPGG